MENSNDYYSPSGKLVSLPSITVIDGLQRLTYDDVQQGRLSFNVENIKVSSLMHDASVGKPIFGVDLTYHFGRLNYGDYLDFGTMNSVIRAETKLRHFTVSVEEMVRMFRALTHPSEAWHHYYQMHIERRDDLPDFFSPDGVCNIKALERYHDVQHYKTSHIGQNKQHYDIVDRNNFALVMIGCWIRHSNRRKPRSSFLHTELDGSLQMAKKILRETIGDGVDPASIAWSDAVDSPLCRSIKLALDAGGDGCFLVLSHITNAFSLSLPVRSANTILDSEAIPIDDGRRRIGVAQYGSPFEVIIVDALNPQHAMLGQLCTWFDKFPFVDCLNLATPDNPLGTFYKPIRLAASVNTPSTKFMVLVNAMEDLDKIVAHLPKYTGSAYACGSVNVGLCHAGHRLFGVQRSEIGESPMAIV